uniref:phosphoribosyltransferase n=1 Tax=Prevotella sp. TaxID=59823 RepID=UPI003FEF9740
MNNYHYLKDYLPVRYQANAQQLADRQTCYNFKDGIINDEVKSGFLNKIQEITNGEKTGWAICFIPASTKSKTQTRYKKLAEAIQASGYMVAIDAIYNEHDHEAGHLTGKTGNPIEGFGFNTSGIAGKKIIVIDDIITRGKTFQMVAEKLLSMGATTVTGLFLAKTINPDYTPYIDPAEFYEEEQTYDCYNGSYAQDVEGWSDQAIDEVFDGDPEAYWNID